MLFHGLQRILYHIFGAMIDKQQYPLYRYCLASTINNHKGNLVSIIGKVVSIDVEEQRLMLQVDPASNKCIKVRVPEFQVNYLFDQNALNTIVDKEDLELAEKFINNKGGNSQLTSKEDNNYTSLMWFAVAENDPLPSKKAQMDIEQKRNFINSASFTKKITVNEFSVNQYIEVRGKCIDQNTIAMQQFTDFEQNFDLASYNYALGLGLQYCEKIMA